MSKESFILISLALVLAVGVPVSADELVASYEDSEMSDLTISTPGEATLTVSRVLGGVGGAPPATDGSYILKWVWTDETDRKITMRHEWATRRLDLAPYNLFTVDVWFDEPNAQPATIGIWDDVFGWAGAVEVPTGIQQWHTVEMDANGLDANNIDHMAAFLFESLAGDAGVLYTDNMWLLEAPQVTAWMPEPFDGAVSVDPNADLSWFAGVKADTHDVYFGTDEAAVSDANTSNTALYPGIYKGNQALGDTSYEPGTLEWLTTCYWRIDEVNTGEPNSPWKGDVWSFKTDPELGYVEVPLVSYEDSETHYTVWASPAIAGDDFSLVLGDKLAGGSTWDPGGALSPVSVPTASDGNNVLGLAWDNEQDLEVEHSYTFTGGFTYDLSGIDEMVFGLYYPANDTEGGFNPLPHSMGLWDDHFAPAFNGTSNLPTTRGEWHTIVIDVSHLDDTGQVDLYSFMFQGHGEDFRPDDEDPNNWGALVFMDNLRLRYAATPLASFPRPADGATGVPLVEKLSWRAGLYADTHDVYFGTDETAVSDANTSNTALYPGIYRGNQALGDTSYDPGFFAASTTYYWRIDEVNGPNTWKGDVWSFTTLDSLVVDNFDLYEDDDALTAVWHDYWTNGTNSELYLETDPQFTRDGNSMEFLYDNSFKSGAPPAFRGSEADASTSELVCGSDWTAAGVKGLVLRYYGDAGNSITGNDKMYVALEDASSNVGVLEHPDMNEFLVEEWREWNIDMEDFNALGLDLTNISKMYVGFGGPRVGQSLAGGAGTVHFDDIELLKPRCIWWLTYQEGDFTGNCVIDEFDLEIMARDWLIGDYNVVATTPSPTGLVAQYEFEGNADDSSGNGHDGTVHGAPTYPAGVSGLAIDLDGVLDYISIPGSNTPGGAFDINDTITVTAWIKVAAYETDFATIISKGDSAWRLARNEGNDQLEFACTGVASSSIYGHIVGITSVDDGQWHHVAGVYDGSGLYLYIDGVLDAWDEATGFMNNNSYEVYIGENAEATGRLWNGLLDDVRVYNRGLSHSEIVSLAGESEIYQAVISPANLSDEEAKFSKRVNFKDYALLADNWLRELLFPF